MTKDLNWRPCCTCGGMKTRFAGMDFLWAKNSNLYLTAGEGFGSKEEKIGHYGTAREAGVAAVAYARREVRSNPQRVRDAREVLDLWGK